MIRPTLETATTAATAARQIPRATAQLAQRPSGWRERVRNALPGRMLPRAGWRYYPTGATRQMPGPYLQAAFFCERVLQEPDGVISAIRIVDQQSRIAIGPDVSDEMPPLVVSLTLVVALKAGETRGRYSLRVSPEAPSGQKLPDFSVPVNFPGGQEDLGVNVVLPLQMQLAEEGLYWFDVLWVDPRAADGEQLLTRMPLRLVYQPQPTQ